MVLLVRDVPRGMFDLTCARTLGLAAKHKRSERVARDRGHGPLLRPLHLSYAVEPESAGGTSVCDALNVELSFTSGDGLRNSGPILMS
jgi:hypothetical protein